MVKRNLSSIFLESQHLEKQNKVHCQVGYCAGVESLSWTLPFPKPTQMGILAEPVGCGMNHPKDESPAARRIE